MKNYVERNIDDESSTVLHGVIEMLANSAETIIFVFLGVAAVTADHEWNWVFVVVTIVLCTIFRIIGKSSYPCILLWHLGKKLEFKMYICILLLAWYSTLNLTYLQQ